jgi:hypothetical protein
MGVALVQLDWGRSALVLARSKMLHGGDTMLLPAFISIYDTYLLTGIFANALGPRAFWTRFVNSW